MTDKLKQLIEGAKHWTEADQAELVAHAQEIESRQHVIYQATAEELAAIDDADRSETAGAEEIAKAFRSFRRV